MTACPLLPSGAAVNATVSFGTWGLWEIRQPIAPKRLPPRDPSPVPPSPTLTLVPRQKAVYAIGERLALQYPGSTRKFIAEATVTTRYFAPSHTDTRRLNSGSYWLYGLVIEGEAWLLNETALLQAEADAQEPVILFPNPLSAPRLDSQSA